MTDWNQFFKQDEFRAYRKQQVKAMAETIKSDAFQGIMGDPHRLQHAQGMLQAFQTMLDLPSHLSGDEKIRELLDHQLQEDVANITKYLMRGYLIGE